MKAHDTSSIFISSSNDAEYERTPVRAPERIHQAILTDGAVMMWMELDELIEQQASAFPQLKQDPQQFPSPIIRQEQLVWEELPLFEVWEGWWDSGASASQRSDLARLGYFLTIWNMNLERLTEKAENSEVAHFAGASLYNSDTANFVIVARLISWLNARYLQQEDLRLQVDLFESLLSVCGLSNAQGMGLVRNSLSHFKNTAKWLGVAESLESMRALHKVRWWIFHNSEQWERANWKFREIFEQFEDGVVPVGDLLDFVSQRANTVPLKAATSPESRPAKNSQLSAEWKAVLSRFICTLVVDSTKSSSPVDYQEHLRAIESIDDLNVSIELFACTKHWFATQSKASKKSEQLKIRLASVTQPAKTTTAEAFSMAADQRLKDWGQMQFTRLALFAPQWADLIEEHLQSSGFANAVYWHLANSRKVRLLENVAFRDGMQRDQRNYDQLSLTWLESRFPSVIQEGLPSSADSTWFKGVRGKVSDATWTALEQAGQWLGCGSDASVVAKYCVGDVNAAELQAHIESGELDVAIGLTLFVRMPLDITTEAEELYRRYKFLISFEDEFGDSSKFRQLQESVAKTHGIGAPERLLWFGDDSETATAGVSESLEESMLQRRSFSGAELELYSKLPAIAAYFSRIVLQHPEFGLGILASDGAAIRDLDGSEKPIASSDMLRIADCVDLQNAQEWERWRAQFTLNDVQQPFAQVFRTLIELEAAEIDESGRGSLRFSGVPLAEKKLASQLTKRGWSCESTVDVAAKLFTLGDAKYVAWLKVGLASMSSQSCDVLEIDSLGFSTTMNSKDLIPLKDVPPQVFSEAAAELTAVMESACRSFPSDVFPEDAFAQLKIAIGKLAKEQGIPSKVSDLILVLGTKKRGYRIHLSTLAVQALPGGRRVFIPELELETSNSHLLEIAKDYPNTARILKIVMDFFNDE